MPARRRRTCSSKRSTGAWLKNEDTEERMARRTRIGLVLLLVVAGPLGVQAQRGRGGEIAAKAAAPVDLTGYCVTVVTEDWRYRMVTPMRGDHPSVPLNAEGVRVAEAWDPARDEASGEQCKAYGAAGVMRTPGRVHITWQDDNALKIETEAGTQTRVLRFGEAQPP